MAFRSSVRFSSWNLGLPMKVRRKVLKKAGTKLATRLRKRLRKVGLRKTGQMNASLKFAMDKREPTGTITFRGTRKDADGHKKRRPIRNFNVAAFHAARGVELVTLTEADQEFFNALVREELAKVFK